MKRATPYWWILRDFADEVVEDLMHVDSRWCWCDPAEDVDVGGEPVLVHREVTWH